MSPWSLKWGFSQVSRLGVVTSSSMLLAPCASLSDEGYRAEVDADHLALRWAAASARQGALPRHPAQEVADSSGSAGVPVSFIFKCSTERC